MNRVVGESEVGRPKCAVCGAKVNRILVSRDGHDVYQCDSCGLGFTFPQPDSIAEQYDSGYFDLYRRRRRFRLRRADSRLRIIELLVEPGRLLDIGCSLGYFVEAAAARGWSASGVEISPDASAEARGFGLDVRAGTLQEAGFPDGSFDCVTMWDVLEHVPDPVAHMLEVRRVLAPAGLVVIGTPDLGHPMRVIKRERWRHLKPAEHIFYFRESSISRLFQKSGFRRVRPPVSGGRSFPGARAAALRSAVAGVARANDVMTVYGVKDDLNIPAD